MKQASSLQVEKVDYLTSARDTSASHRRSARIAALGGNIRDADAALVRGGHIYNASERRAAAAASIQASAALILVALNIRMFRFERFEYANFVRQLGNANFRALEIAVKHKTHIDTVLAYRRRYLDATGRGESDDRFVRQLANVEVDWTNIREKIAAEDAKAD